MRPRSKVEFGDFQTPFALAERVCHLLVRAGENPDVVLEPTAGQGAFLDAAARSFPHAQLYGWDIHAPYVEAARARLAELGAAGRARVEVADFFQRDWAGELKRKSGRLLLLGNPPWVTNAALTTHNGANAPTKSNFLGLRGLAARTGKSNFDIAEWMLMRLFDALGRREASLAVLCKTTTARKFLRYVWRHEGRTPHAALHRIDAFADFGASVEACLLHVRFGTSGERVALVFPDLATTAPAHRLGMAGRDLVSDLDRYHRYRHLEGCRPLPWRSGIKHDCAAIMELTPQSDGTFRNGLDECVALEPGFVFPLLKSTDLARGRTTPRRCVLVTQRDMRDDTSAIADLAPLTWAYLQKHVDRFGARKSSIYRQRAPFALFGIGDYSFAPWKVAISGLHETARFLAVGPQADRPMFFDDTCYFVPVPDEETASLLAQILNSAPCLNFLQALVCPGSKRPYTIDILQRLDPGAIAVEAGYGTQWRELQERTTESRSPSQVQSELLI